MGAALTDGGVAHKVRRYGPSKRPHVASELVSDAGRAAGPTLAESRTSM
jgi:hypothetical protein